MDNKGITPVGALFSFMIFIVIWFVWLGGWLNQVGEIAVQTAGLTGIEAFAMFNLNFIIFICLILGMMAWTMLGGNQ
jgi:hypothetical protein